MTVPALRESIMNAPTPEADIWISSAAFAEAAGIRSHRTARAILRAAAVEGLPWQGARLDVRQVKGGTGRGGLSYQVRLGSLPPSVMARVLAARGQVPEARALAIREGVGAQIQQRLAEAGLRATPRRGEGGEARIEAKLAVLAAWDLYRQGTKLSTRRALEAFVLAVRQGQIALPPVVRAALPDISRASLQRWQRQLRQEGWGRLAGRYGPGPRASCWARHPELEEYAIGLIASHVQRASTIHLALAHQFPGVAPDCRTVQRFVADYRAAHAGTLMRLANPDAWRSKYEVAYGDWDERITRLNQQWELDSTPADLMLVDGRYALVGCIDIYSRRLTLLVAKTSKAAAIAALLRRAFLAWGMPEEVVTDQGQDYISQHIRTILDALGIQRTPRPAFQPTMKPFIERVFRTFSHDLVEILRGFIGHNVAERESIRARQSFAERLLQKDASVELPLTAAEFQDFCDQWTEQRYHQRRHRELGMSPAQRAAAYDHPIPRIQDIRALDLLLIPSGWRTVQKKGIEYEGAWFIADESGELALVEVGTRVEVRSDPADVGWLYVFGGEDGQYLCMAQCPARTGISQAEVAAKSKALQRAKAQERQAALKALGRKISMPEVIEGIFEDRAEAAIPVEALPPAEVLPYMTPALQAASEAIAAEAPIRPMRTLQVWPPEELVDEAPPPRHLVEDSPELEPREQYLALCRLPQLSPEDETWMENFERLPEGRGLQYSIRHSLAQLGERSPYAGAWWRRRLPLQPEEGAHAEAQ